MPIIIIITIIPIITIILLGTFCVPDIELSILQRVSDSILLTKGWQKAPQRPIQSDLVFVSKLLLEYGHGLLVAVGYPTWSEFEFVPTHYV